MLTEFTGRWEELISRPEFRGHRVRIAIVDQPPAATDAKFCGTGFQPVKKHGQDGRATSRDTKFRTAHLRGRLIQILEAGL